MDNRVNEQQACNWLSESNYRSFLDRCGGSHDRAVLLYERHVALSVASFEVIHRFEVLIRNAIDRVLGQGQPQTPVKETWLLDFETLNPHGIRQVITAIERLKKGKTATREQVGAGLSFAFWAGLFGRRYEELWRHRLRSAFPHAELMRKDLSLRMRLLRHFRNQVAHHESLLDQDVSARLNDMLAIAGWIDPAAREWLSQRSNALELAWELPPPSKLVRC
jgi:hypothetical protein